MLVAKDVTDGIPKWRITKFTNVHNHEVLKEDEARFLPAYRSIQIDDKKRILLLFRAGCAVNLIMRVLELEKGVEPGQLPFLEKDVKDFFQSYKNIGREKDASELLMICKSLKDQDADFCYDFTIDENNKLEHIAWSFGDSVRAYRDFGDVVVFDTTYRQNRYDMPLGVRAGVNNHGCSESSNYYLKGFFNVKTKLQDFVEQVRVAASIQNLVGEEAAA
ncbi:putative protein FAR1-RELATED SEQUENCE 10 [Cornus florida]|uniref:putative protein FAR1-RELATED SEQUENCE 10 n=1 Tax=Cornus florida TaxID=4283 RepID=UPI00289FF383|nr:putative protein FAR1-RELATED SEQUENCE 10 [Cornus florida]